MEKKVEAWIAMNTELGEESGVLKSLLNIDEVKEAHMTYGGYDIMARIGAESYQELKDILSLKIKRIDKVRSTLTMMIE